MTDAVITDGPWKSLRGFRRVGEVRVESREFARTDSILEDSTTRESAKTTLILEYSSKGEREEPPDLADSGAAQPI